jgi:hypothetical protein
MASTAQGGGITAMKSTGRFRVRKNASGRQKRQGTTLDVPQMQ